MFWQFENWSTSQIDKVLEKEDVTLGELLAEDDVIQECKAQNQKLLQFLKRPEILEQLVDLIITEPAVDVDEKLRFKHSNVACELLTTDLDLINDALIEENLLKKIFNFIDSEAALNPLLASFFSKVLSLLCIKRTIPVLRFLQSKENFVQRILFHIDTSAIMDFLVKLITIPDAEIRQEIVTWLSEKGLVPQLISMFSPDVPDEKRSNAAQYLCDSIKVIREQQSMLQEKALPNPILDEIESTQSVSMIMDFMFQTRSENSIVNGIHVLQSLIEYKRHNANINQPVPSGSNSLPTTSPTSNAAPDFDGVPQILAQPLFGRNDSTDHQVSPLDASRLARAVCQVHDAVISRLPLFHSILVDPPPKSAIITTVGTIEKPLGWARLEVAHFIRALLSSNSPSINQSLLESNTVLVLVELFFEYPWNSFLHTQVEQSIKLLFENTRTSSPVTSPDVESPETRDAAVSLARQLIHDAKLIQRLIDVWFSFNGSENLDKPRPGYMGHLTRIANHVVEASSQDSIQKIISDLPTEVQVTWDNFVKTSLSDVITRIKTPLVGDAPSGGYGESHQQESALHQAFMEYQMQQMTRNLCTQIGFNTSEFSELDKETIQSRADQLSKLNFDLEDQMRKITQDGPTEMEEDFNPQNSSDEGGEEDEDLCK